MKKILATTLAFVLLSTVFFVSKVPVRAAEDTTTKGTFLSENRSTPEYIDNATTCEPDNSNVSKTFGTALKITPGNPGQLYFNRNNPISGGKGMLMYAKTEAGDKTTTPMFYIDYDNNNNVEAANASPSGTWYILTENGAGWEKRDYNYYGCELEPGFEGYIYIPFSNYQVLNDTDKKIIGYNLYLLKGDSYANNNITFGQPIIVTSEGIPNAKSINCNGTEYVYFAVEDTTTGTFLSATRSMPSPIVGFTAEADNSDTLKTFGTAVKIISDGENRGEFYFAEENPVDGGKGMLMYAKTMDDGIATRPQIYIIADTGSAYSYYGKWYTLNKNDEKWQELNYDNYGGELPSGFDGYIYIPFDAITQVPLQKTSKVMGYSVQLSRNGEYTNGDYITLGQPIIVTSEGIPNAKSINCNGTEYVYFAVEDTTTGTFLSATRSMPSPIVGFTAEADNSDTLKTFGTAVKIISDGENRGEFYFAEENPVDGGKGMLMYAKTMDDGIATRPQIYIIADTGSAYSYYGKWYTLNKNDEKWQELNYDNYGGELPSGFDGYIYIPFDAITQVPLQKTSKVKGYSVYLSRNGKSTYGDYITFGQPIIVTSEGIPNAEKIDCGDRVYYYFAHIGDVNGDKTTDIRDLVHLNSVLANPSEYTENADVNNDGVIDSSDLDALRKILLGISG